MYSSVYSVYSSVYSVYSSTIVCTPPHRRRRRRRRKIEKKQKNINIPVMYSSWPVHMHIVTTILVFWIFLKVKKRRRIHGRI